MESEEFNTGLTPSYLLCAESKTISIGYLVVQKWGEETRAKKHREFGESKRKQLMDLVDCFIMPIILGGFTNYWLPVLLGVPDMLFPRINNLSL